jgi:hypothetical protein
LSMKFDENEDYELIEGSKISWWLRS